MANPYDPGHPVAFWLTILLLLLGAYTGGRAVLTSQDCESKGLEQEWQWMPPKWECKPLGFQL